MNTTTSTARDPATEQTLWRGSPSQVINLPQYLLWLAVFIVLMVIGVFMWDAMVNKLPAPMLWLVCVLALSPLLIAGWKWLVIANTIYELTSQRLRLRWGVFNKHLDELELYRVRDYRLEQPFFLRLFARSNISLHTSDRTNPTFVLRAIPEGESVREQIRTHVEEARQRRGVRELDVE